MIQRLEFHFEQTNSLMAHLMTKRIPRFFNYPQWLLITAKLHGRSPMWLGNLLYVLQHQHHPYILSRGTTSCLQPRCRKMNFLLVEYPPKDYSLKAVIATTVVPELPAAPLILPRCSESLSVNDDVFGREMYPD